MEHKTISLADQVFQQLEDDILLGKYKRGEILTETKLCEIMGVSRTPIREALRRLSSEHIIEETTKGSLVLGIDKNDVRDIFAIREKIEGEAAAMAAENATEEDLAALSEAVDLQEYYAQKENFAGMEVQDKRFHKLIYSSCKSVVYYDTLIPLHKKTSKFRRLSVESHSRAKVSAKEHREILNALKQRNSDLAKRLMTEHITKAYENISKGL